MILTTFLLTILQAFSISLGVGSSTLAITNFFVAIADGKIDDTERRMMGVVYIVLRVAMVSILLTSGALMTLRLIGGEELMGGDYALLTIIATLFLNAILMTKHIMPSTFGPSIQAGSWYALAALMSILAQGYTEFGYALFLLTYITWIVLATAIVNGIMAYLRAHRHNVIT
jgi:hypothetical protein